MFVQHKQLKVLNIPANKVARLRTSSSGVQLAFPDHPPQRAAAYLVAISNGAKVMVVVGFFLTESKESIFFVPQRGEVSVEEAEQVYEEGFIFAESMGFVLGETDFHLQSSTDQQKLWQSLPICKLHERVAEKKPEQPGVVETKNQPVAAEKIALKEVDIETYRKRSLESLGRFLSSM